MIGVWMQTIFLALSSISPSSQYGRFGTGSTAIINGQNFYSNFSQVIYPFIKFNSVVLINPTIINSTQIIVTLGTGYYFSLGVNNVSLSLNGGTTYTTDSVIYTIYDLICASNCSGNGVCNNGVCTCNPGWTTNVTDCDTLLPNACGVGCNNGTCINYNTCNCTAGYGGPTCATYICTNNCNSKGTCVSPGTCSCLSGWSGTDCSIPDCSNITNCINGTCNAPNNCTCIPGYTGVNCLTPTCSPSCVNGYCIGKK